MIINNKNEYTHNRFGEKYLSDYCKNRNVNSTSKFNKYRYGYNKLVYDVFFGKYLNDISYIKNKDVDINKISFYDSLYFLTLTYNKEIKSISSNSYHNINYINSAFKLFHKNLSIELLGKKTNRSRKVHLQPFCWMFIDVAGSRHGSLSISENDIGINDHHHGLMYFHPDILDKFLELRSDHARWNSLIFRSYYIKEIDIRKIDSIEGFVISEDYATKAMRKLHENNNIGADLDIILPFMETNKLGNFVFGNSNKADSMN
ncbi:MAG: hypothetical protein N4A65_00685 [Cohaesibacter sp.]|nr:hypothetical protein [Cohaesibacter sp.]